MRDRSGEYRQVMSDRLWEHMFVLTVREAFAELHESGLARPEIGAPLGLSPTTVSAAVLPWLKATSQCSTRSRRRLTTLSYSAMSPATNTPGTEDSSVALAITPPLSPSSSPAARARVTSGITPTPITTASASSS